MLENADLFADLCDVVERAWQHWPVDSYKDGPRRHTSDYSRAAATRILDVLGRFEVLPSLPKTGEGCVQIAPFSRHRGIAENRAKRQ